MASIARMTPENGAARFRDGCRLHFQVRPSKKETALGLKKDTKCTKTEAQAVVDAWTGERRKSGQHVSRDNPATYADLSAEWQAFRKAGDTKPSTLQKYKYNALAHIIPQLGTLRVLDTAGDDVIRFTAYLRGTGDTPAHLRNIRSNLAAMLDHWASTGRPLPLDRGGNPVNLWRHGPVISSSGQLRRRNRVWIPEPGEIEKWKAECPLDMLAIIEVIVYTADRGSEAWAHRAEDITFGGKDPDAPLGPQLVALAGLGDAAWAAASPHLRIERKLERDGTPGTIKNPYYGVRDLPMDRELCAVLGAHLTAWPERDGWLFWNYRAPGGQYLRIGSDREWVAAEAARLYAEHIRPGVGRSMKQIAELLGIPAGSVAYLLARTPPADGEPACSLATDGVRVFPRAHRGVEPAQRGLPGLLPAAGTLRLWSGDPFRRQLREAAKRAGLPLPRGQVTHTFRHYRAASMLKAGLTPEEVGEWIGDSPEAVRRNYSNAMPGAKQLALDVIAAERRNRYLPAAS